MIPWQVSHDVIYDIGDDDYVEWHCPVCQRRVRVYSHPLRPEVLEQGDPTATHRGAAGAPGACELAGLGAQTEGG